VGTDRADFGGFVAGKDVATVATLPDGDFVGFEDDVVVDVL